MRTSIFYTLLACFVFACAQVNAQSLTTIYSGTESPAQAGWTELKLDNTISTATTATVTQDLASGVLQLRSTNDDANQFSQLGWYKTGLGLNPETGYTIEIRAKVTDASKYGAFNIQGFDNSGKGFRIGIYDNSLAESTNPLNPTNVLKTDLDNTTEFHTYHLAVQPGGTATLYRDLVEIATFNLSDFYFDNIIENGGFEDGTTDMSNAADFPDFQSNGLLYRTNEPEVKPEGYLIYESEGNGDPHLDAAGNSNPINWVKSGKYSLIFNNNGKDEMTGDQYDPNISERARTREIPVKLGEKYDVSISRARIADEPYGWRDMGAFYDYQTGTQNGTDARGESPLFAGCNDGWWQIHNQSIYPSTYGSIRFEFPSWIRDDVKNRSITAFDDFYIKEDIGLNVNSVRGMADPVFPENFVNLIANGGFEDWHTNNDGMPYDWALSDPDNTGCNWPVKYNPLWGVDLRIQRNVKGDEDNKQWAHNSTSCLRFSTLNDDGSGCGGDDGRGDSNKSFMFTKDLVAGKSYRFNFWHRNPQYGETAWLKVSVGNNVVWGQLLGSRDQEWTNADITFTATDENKTLSLYIDDYCCGWYNIYLDDLVLYEIPNLEDPLLAGKTNLIANGDFENETIDNEGNDYEWELASNFGGSDDNYPVAWSDVWGAYVRLQDKQKGSSDLFGDQDTGLQWAHSGTHSLRMSYLDNQDAAVDFGDPNAFETNMNFVKELEPNQKYTFVFWIKTANYPDHGDLMINNGDSLIWKQTLSTKYINWSRQSVTFTTTADNHTLRMYTEFTGWYNFYLDDLFLYKETNPLTNNNSYLFFGKSMGTESTNVDIESVKVDNTGAFAPLGVKQIFAAPANLKAWSLNGGLVFNVVNPAIVRVYTVTGLQVANLNVEKEANITLPQGVYIVKSVSAGIPETIKVVNK